MGVKELSECQCKGREFLVLLLVSPYLVKIVYDLVQEPNAFLSTIVDLIFRVKLVKVWNRSKHDSHVLVRLAVQVLSRKTKEICHATI